MKQIIFCCVILVLLSIGLGRWLQAGPPTQSTAPAAAKPTPAADPFPTPLPAEQFTGRTRDAYEAAAEIPDILAGLHCYCGCDKSIGHRSLLDCFVDDHGAGWMHCVNEALDAHSLFMTGTPPEEIRQFIDRKYGPQP